VLDTLCATSLFCLDSCLVNQISVLALLLPVKLYLLLKIVDISNLRERLQLLEHKVTIELFVENVGR